MDEEVGIQSVFARLMEEMGDMFLQSRNELVELRPEIMRALELAGMRPEAFRPQREEPGWHAAELARLSEFLLDVGHIEVALTSPTISRLEVGATGITVRSFTYAYLLGIEELLFPAVQLGRGEAS